MSTESEIHDIWDDHWAGSGDVADVLALLRSRFTQEAFARIASFVSEDDKLILEAGCGTGRFVTLLAQRNAGATVTGIDVSTSALTIARRLADASGCRNAVLRSGSAASLDFPSDHFDMVFNEGVVSLFNRESEPAPDTVVREMVRVTRPGGKVLVSVPNWYCLPHTFYKWKRGVQYEYGFEDSYTHKRLATLLAGAGLAGIESAGYYPAYGFFRLAPRLKTRFFSKLADWTGRIVDRLDGPRISRAFGFYIMAVGRKQ